MSEEAVLSPVGWLKQTLLARMPSLLTPKRRLNAPSPPIEWSRFKSKNRLPSPYPQSPTKIGSEVGRLVFVFLPSIVKGRGSAAVVEIQTAAIRDTVLINEVAGTFSTSCLWRSHSSKLGTSHQLLTKALFGSVDMSILLLVIPENRL